ncbi:type VI secretion system baseplate subunit TssF [Trinickia dinghuensis]|uniref:Type VI secretion system baseplate subunit TssF n=1 Tax=Trinickia dinghuensis TaxID=2291023 RepID=A0A3D8JYQ8_9BURK|nr:type VI secretion system baseplate subunit TssF [Trinickia dinghuensis]RDU98303.1 type VI secretion system baseplate subunit TssF [Trinickia dinghuensis]
MTAADDDLLREYERELAILRRSLGEFAKRHPEAAARLSISGEHSDDPHVERIIQSIALLNARASVRINDNYPELPTSLLEILYPEYLRPFPSCSIAHFDGDAVIEKLTEPFTVARGAELKTRKGGYPFRTLYDVVVAPLRITAARYAPTTSAPPKVRLHEETSGIFSITLSSLPERTLPRKGMPKRMRLFVDGDRRTVAATMDTLLLRTSTAFLEVDNSETWISLDAVPLTIAGFDDSESSIQRHDKGQSQFRFLLEYFSFPEKFDFIDIDLTELLRIAAPCTNVTVHLPIKGLHRDSTPAQLLRGVSTSNFKQFCTPVINLFSASSEPLSLERMAFPIYPIVPSTTKVSDTSVYRVDTVRLTEETPQGTVSKQIEPYQSLRHMSQLDSEIFWQAECDGRLAEFVPGQDMLLSLVDWDGEMTNVAGEQIDIDLTCTSGNLPATLQAGDPQGDFVHANEPLTGRVSMLRPATQSAERSKDHDHLWDLVAMLSAGALNLCQAGLPAFKRLLTAHLPSHSTNANASRHIESLVHLAREAAIDWVIMEPQPALVRGIRVRMAVDETRLADCAVSVFARVLETVFVHYAPANSFIQLQLISAQNGAELFQGQPMPGAIELL